MGRPRRTAATCRPLSREREVLQAGNLLAGPQGRASPSPSPCSQFAALLAAVLAVPILLRVPAPSVRLRAPWLLGEAPFTGRARHPCTRISKLGGRLAARLPARRPRAHVHPRHQHLAPRGVPPKPPHRAGLPDVRGHGRRGGLPWQTALPPSAVQAPHNTVPHPSSRYPPFPRAEPPEHLPEVGGPLGGQRLQQAVSLVLKLRLVRAAVPGEQARRDGPGGGLTASGLGGGGGGGGGMEEGGGQREHGRWGGQAGAGCLGFWR